MLNENQVTSHVILLFFGAIIYMATSDSSFQGINRVLRSAKHSISEVEEFM
jgi:hypothetical protein